MLRAMIRECGGECNKGKPRNSLIEQPMSFVMRSLCSQLFPAFSCGRPKDILIHLLKEIIINMERDRNHS